MPRWRRILALGLLPLGLAASAAQARRFPNVVLITVDTVRADHVSAYGYARPTTPNIDRLLAAGARFTEARTIEPLTAPSLASMLTSRYPHEHGTTRNGLRIRPGLDSLGKVLGRRGFRTAAFVGNWTLKDKLTGFSEHFQDYVEVFSRKRWFLFGSEATAEDLTDEALDWAGKTVTADPDRPFLLWVHYVEPHAPYRTHPEFAARLGFGNPEHLSAAERYDTEIAYVDHSIGRLLGGLRKLSPDPDTLYVFASDHGESLGERGEWGHGRTLYDDALRVPLGIVWSGHVPAEAVSGPMTLLDLMPTVLGLLGHPAPDGVRGIDWTAVIQGRQEPPRDRVTFYQAHKGAVQRVEDRQRAREHGLLQLGVLIGDRMEIYDVHHRVHQIFRLDADPQETLDVSHGNHAPSKLLASWWHLVDQGLVSADRLPAPQVDAETEEQMRALGYL